MNELTAFQNEEFGQVRTTIINGEPWFVGKDVASILGYERATKAIQTHVDDEDKDGIPIRDSIGRMQQTPIINESGLYSLVLSSKLPTAKKFKRWVTSEILPSIRKHGAYMTDEVLINAIRNPENLDMLVEELAKDKKEKRAMKEKIGILEPKGVYFDNLVFLGVLTSIRDTANELKIKPMSFTQFLLDNKYVYRKKNQRIFPYQQHVHSELFEIKDFYCNGFHCEQTCVTVKGKLHFLEILKEKEMI